MKRATITEELAYGSTALDRLTGEKKAASPAPSAPPPAPELPKSAMIKLSVFVGRDEDAYLEALASAAKFSGGKKISKTKLVEAMVRAFRNSKLDVRGVRNEDELLSRVTAQLR
ncbi:MAG: hypothetical protein PHR56_02175 [Dehalococcoidales bacterium]|nr:hypothetical protein [Dehalococcoidales bacterium]